MINHSPWQLHPRTMPVQKAQVDLNIVILEFAKEKGLTDIELLQCLTEHIQMTLKYMLRAERHPDEPGKKADEE